MAMLKIRGDFLLSESQLRFGGKFKIL